MQQIIQDMPDFAKEWAEKRLSKLGYMPSEEEIMYIRDYLYILPQEEPKTVEKLYKIRWDDILERSFKWHEKIAERKWKIRGYGGNPDDIDEVMSFSNGFRIVKVTSANGLDYEGNAMGHCVGGGSYDDHDYVTIFSLRDPDNIPHCTIEYMPRTGALRQIQGKANQPLQKKYVPMVRAFISHLNPQSIESYYFERSDFNFIFGNTTGPNQDENQIYDMNDIESLPEVLFETSKNHWRGKQSLICRGKQSLICRKFVCPDNEAIVIKEKDNSRVWKIIAITSPRALDSFHLFTKKFKPEYIENALDFHILVSDKKDGHQVYNLLSSDLPDKITTNKEETYFPVIHEDVNYGYLIYEKQFGGYSVLHFNTKITDDSIERINQILRKNPIFKNAEFRLDKPLSNYVFGNNSPKDPLQLHHISKLPKYIFENSIRIKDQAIDITFPRKTQLVSMQLSPKGCGRTAIRIETVDIVIENCSGTISLPGAYMNNNVRLKLNHNTGDIHFGDSLDNVISLDLTGSYNVKNIPSSNNILNRKVISPDGEPISLSDMSTFANQSFNIR